MNKKTNSLETKRIFIYLAITFLLTYGYCFIVIYPLVNGENLLGIPAAATQFLVAAGMFFPAIGVLLTRLITKEGFKNCWLRPNFKGNIKTYLLAYFGPGILTLAGTILYFVLFKDNFDPECGLMKVTLEAAGTPADQLPVPLHVLLIIQGIEALFIGPLLNFFTCFGEEWGWRGYLLPKMSEKFSLIPMLLINGVIWGLWHAPLTAIGHNYGMGYSGFPFTGILMMCLFCTVLGVFFSYISLKTKSCIPAVLGHGAVNSFSAIGIYFTKDGGNPFIGPAPTGIIGMIPFIIVGILMILHLKKKN